MAYAFKRDNNSILLGLEKAEAQVLLDLLRRVGGDWAKTGRMFSMAVSQALSKTELLKITCGGGGYYAEDMIGDFVFKDKVEATRKEAAAHCQNFPSIEIASNKENFILTLTENQAYAIKSVVGVVTGNPEKSRRGYCDNIYYALNGLIPRIKWGTVSNGPKFRDTIEPKFKPWQNPVKYDIKLDWKPIKPHYPKPNIYKSAVVPEPTYVFNATNSGKIEHKIIEMDMAKVEQKLTDNFAYVMGEQVNKLLEDEVKNAEAEADFKEIDKLLTEDDEHDDFFDYLDYWEDDDAI